MTDALTGRKSEPLLAVDTSLSPASERLRCEVREWAVTVGRKFAREADRLHRLPQGLYATLDSCPVRANPYVGRLENPYANPVDMGITEDGSNVLGVTVTEELAYGDLTLVYLVGGTGIGARVVNLLGTPEQVERWDRPDVKHTAFGLTEPGCGSDAASLTTTATRDGDVWVINGRKIFTSFGAMAEYVVVFATIDRALGRRGIRAFVVPAGTPGYGIAKENEDKMGVRSSTTSELVFDHVVVPLDHCLGSEERQPHSFSTALRTLNTTRPTVAAQALGVAQATVDLSKDVTGQRSDGFSPARRERLEGLYTGMDAALQRVRLMIRAAAWQIDQGSDYEAASSSAKAYGCQVAERVCLRAMQLMGSEGYSELHLAEKWHRDIKITDIYEGTGNIHRLVVSKSLFATSAGRR